MLYARFVKRLITWFTVVFGTIATIAIRKTIEAKYKGMQDMKRFHFCG